MPGRHASGSKQVLARLSLPLLAIRCSGCEKGGDLMRRGAGGSTPRLLNLENDLPDPILGAAVACN